MYADPSGHLAISIGLFTGYIVGGAAWNFGISVVTQLAENDWDGEKINWLVVSMETLMGGLDGFLAASGLGPITSLLLSGGISGMQSIIIAGLSGERISGGEILVSIIIGSLSSLIPNAGIDARYLGGLYKYSSSVLETAKSATKIGNYTFKKNYVKKTVIKNSIGFISSKIGVSGISYGLDYALGELGIY